MGIYDEKLNKILDRIYSYKKTKLILAAIFVILLVSTLIPALALLPGFLESLETRDAYAFFSELIIVGIVLIWLIGLLIVVLLDILAWMKYREVRKRTIFICKCEYGHIDSKNLAKEFDKRNKEHDKKWIIDTANKYYDLCEKYVVKQSKIDDKKHIENEGKGDFDGWFWQFVGWEVLGIIITVFTLGLGYPLAYVLSCKWEYKHTVYDGKRLNFDGSSLELFKKWIVWILLSIVTIGIFAIFIPKKLLRWKLSNLHIAGEEHIIGSEFTGNAITYFLFRLVIKVVNLFTFWFIKPITTAWQNRYIQKRLLIDGRKTSFDGMAIQLIGRYVLWMLLAVITLGIYAILLNLRLKKWVAKHTHIEPGIQQVQVFK